MHFAKAVLDLGTSLHRGRHRLDFFNQPRKLTRVITQYVTQFLSTDELVFKREN